MSTQEKLKCSELVESAFKSRFEDLMLLYNAWLDGSEVVEDLGSLNEYGLSFDYVKANTFDDQEEGYFKYLISWGGPSEEFRIFVNKRLAVTAVEFWRMDWFDGAKFDLSGEELTKFTEFFENYLESCGIVERMYEAAQDEEEYIRR